MEGKPISPARAFGMQRAAAEIQPKAPNTTDFKIIAASDDRVPEGSTHLDAEVYLHNDEIIVLGYPDALPNAEEQHSCDLMGCGSLGKHVIARIGLELCGKEAVEAGKAMGQVFQQAIADHKAGLPTPRRGLIKAIKQVLQVAPTPWDVNRQSLYEAAKRYFGTDFFSA